MQEKTRFLDLIRNLIPKELLEIFIIAIGNMWAQNPLDCVRRDDTSVEVKVEVKKT